MVQRKIFGLKWEGLTGRLRKLHNEELHDLYTTPHQNTFIIPTDAHYYKNHRMLKQFKKL